MKKVILFFVALFVTQISFAQQEVENLKPYELRFNAWWGGRFRLVDKDGLIVNEKVKKEQMRNLLSEYPQGMKTYNQYLRGRRTGRIIGYSTGVVGITGVGLMIASLDYGRYGANVKNEKLYWIGTGLLYTGAAIDLIVIPIAISTIIKAKRLSRAYNNHISEKYSLKLGISNQGLGLALKF